MEQDITFSDNFFINALEYNVQYLHLNYSDVEVKVT